MRYPLMLLFFFLAGTNWSQTGSLTINLEVKPDQKNKVLRSDVFILAKGKHRDVRHSVKKSAQFRLDSLEADTFFVRVKSLEGLGDTSFFQVIEAGDHVVLNIPYPPTCSYNQSKMKPSCPVCHKKDNVVPIVYGYWVESDNAKKKKRKRFYAGGCEITNCDPHWHCQRDKLSF